MQDKKTLENIAQQVKLIEKNNLDNLESMTSIEMLLTSNNNGKSKDESLSHKFSQLKDKMQETINSTHDIIFMLGEDQKNNF